MVLAQMQGRRGTAAQWASANPVLGAGEFGWESDTNKMKVGNGGSTWSALPYFPNVTGVLSTGDLTTGAINSGDILAEDLTADTVTTPALSADAITTDQITTPSLLLPWCRIHLPSTQSIPHNTNTTMNLTSVEHIDSAYFTVAAGVVTLVEDGLYDLVVHGEFDEFSGAQYSAMIWVGRNGTGTPTQGKLHNTFVGSGGFDEIWRLTGTSICVDLTAGDTLRGVAYQFSSPVANKDFNWGDLTIRKVG